MSVHDKLSHFSNNITHAHGIRNAGSLTEVLEKDLGVGQLGEWTARVSVQIIGFELAK